MQATAGRPIARESTGEHRARERGCGPGTALFQGQHPARSRWRKQQHDELGDLPADPSLDPCVRKDTVNRPLLLAAYSSSSFCRLACRQAVGKGRQGRQELCSEGADADPLPASSTRVHLLH